MGLTGGLHPRQTQVVYLAGVGHNVILGTAGTGKSTMAVLRARHLALDSDNRGPVLLLTFNSTLVTYLRYLAPQGVKDLQVENFHTFARGYLNARGLMSYGAIADERAYDRLVGRALTATRSIWPSSRTLARDTEWFKDEFAWISGMGLTTEAEYQAAARVGRATPVATGAARERVWKARSIYLEDRTAAGLRYDWFDIAGALGAALSEDKTARRCKHIVVDEGQDLSPAALRALTDAARPDGSFTFFGDYHQAIYGQGLSWRSSGINLGSRPVEKFRDNFRNTAQIARVAIAMAGTPYLNIGADDLVEPLQPTADGPLPTLVQCSDVDAEVALIRGLAAVEMTTKKVAILARTNAAAEAVARGLVHTSLRGGNLKTWNDQPGLYVGAYHSAKGLEFDTVYLPHLDTDHLPHTKVAAAFTEEDALAREARLVYVSVTRARSTLVATFSGTLTPLIPTNSGLWDRQVHS